MLFYYVSLLFLSRLLQLVQQRASFVIFSLPLKNKPWLKCWVNFINLTNLPLNRHTRTCSKHFANAEGSRLYPDEVPSLTLPSNNRSSGNNWRKPPRYRFANLGNEPFTIVLNIRFARGAIKRRSTCASPDVLAFPFAGSQLHLFVMAGSSCSTPWKSWGSWQAGETS